MNQHPTHINRLEIDPQNKERILKKRAYHLAKAYQNHSPPQDKMEILSFEIGSEKYGLEIAYISKVYSLKDLTPLPGTPSYVAGMINVRGEIVPVIDFRKILDLANKKINTHEKVIIISVADATLGILADEIIGLEVLLMSEMQRDLPTLNGVKIEFVKGITSFQLTLFDPLKIISHPLITLDNTI